VSDRRLIEEAFPLRQASLDSVHEKNVRHGHISTLHIWPARRPLAACRAAIITALLPDPGDPSKREELIRRIGGTVVTTRKKTNGKMEDKVETEGGILHWGRENNPDLTYFRDEIRKAFGGCAPKVLDMFAGGGAIPLEAMRLGCDVTAVDYNPVAWFLLKCTLEYPQKLAGQRWPLPGPAQPDASGNGALDLDPAHDGDLAAHVRYWGNWVLERARADLAEYYPTLPLDPSRPEGTDNPLCPAVAYLWARTVPHPDPTKYGLQVPLLKTLWLCKKPGKKRALRLRYNPEANRFDFEVFTPKNDCEVGQPTMTRNGAMCPSTCEGEAGAFLRTDYLQRMGREGHMRAACTAVVVDVPRVPGRTKNASAGKEYRLPTMAELEAADRAIEALQHITDQIPHGLPHEQIPLNPRIFWAQLYGLDTYSTLFSPRQLLALSAFVRQTRFARDAMCNALKCSGSDPLIEATTAYLAIAVNRLADRNSTICHWQISAEKIGNTFSRFALPMAWDYSEIPPHSTASGGYEQAVEWVADYIQHATSAVGSEPAQVLRDSAVQPVGDNRFDAIVTDPPYYDAIPYTDIANFFYVWLRRTVGDAYPEQYQLPTATRCGELVADRLHPLLENPRTRSLYEQGMAAAFKSACRSLKPNGRMVVVFAHKQPQAWETLVSAMIHAGFIVTASWPIDTERGSRIGALGTASLSSSVWLVCRKRPTNAGKGWYKQVQPQMKARITERLRYFWDQSVRGPDFIWSAVGPGLEAFSAYDEVRRNDGKPFTVSEFLREVRRLTTDFALGQILHGESSEGLDEWTSVYLMHRQSFGLAGGPVGECILLAQGYGLELGSLTGPRGILAKGKVKPPTNGDAPEEAEEAAAGGSELRLLSWEERKRDDLGEPHPTGGLPLIDTLHRLMREWASGEVARVSTYADRHGLRENELFWRVAQAVTEMAESGSRERSVLEAVISWGRGLSSSAPTTPALALFEAET
jgi:adenine-specific DNA methylase